MSVSVDLLSSLVPGYGGSTALVYFVASLSIAGLVAGSVAVRTRTSALIERVSSAVVLFALALIGLLWLPSELQSRDTQYRAVRNLTAREADAMTMLSVGIDPGFVDFLRSHMSNQRFFVVQGPSIHTGGPRIWAQIELLPRIEEFADSCDASWIVFVHAPAHLEGTTLGHVLRYKPGFSLARNMSRCAS